jgi:hypothetical protein
VSFKNRYLIENNTATKEWTAGLSLGAGLAGLTRDLPAEDLALLMAGGAAVGAPIGYTIDRLSKPKPKQKKIIQESVENTPVVKQYIQKHNLIPNDPKDPYIGLKPKKTEELALDLLKYRLEDVSQKLTPEIQKKFLLRFKPFWDFGTGDGLVYDKKTKKVYELSHEENVHDMIKGLPSNQWHNEVGLKVPRTKPTFLSGLFKK